jgi:hypothetical protein
VATKVKEGTTTSSPGPTPQASSASSSGELGVEGGVLGSQDEGAGGEDAGDGLRHLLAHLGVLALQGEERHVRRGRGHQ